MNMNFSKVAVVLMIFLGPAYGQTLLWYDKENHSTQTEQSDDDFGADVQIEGVTVINDKLYIDGVRVPKGTHIFTSKKTGKHYLIEWGKNDNITVREK